MMNAADDKMLNDKEASSVASIVFFFKFINENKKKILSLHKVYTPCVCVKVRESEGK